MPRACVDSSTSGTEPVSSTRTPPWGKARSEPCNRCSCRTHRPGALLSVVRSAFEDVLGPLYAAAQYERMPLFEYYEFSPTLGPSVRERQRPRGRRRPGALRVPGGFSLPNVCGFYESFLTSRSLPAHDYHYVSYIHGDLNAANILVDARHNVWVIDYFHAGPGHVLKDLAKFENDLLYLLTPIDDESQLAEAVAVIRALREVADLKAPLPDRPDELRAPPSRPGVGGARSAAPDRRRAVPRGPPPAAAAGGPPALRRAHTQLPGAVCAPEACALASACSLAEQIARPSMPSRPCGSTGLTPT